MKKKVLRVDLPKPERLVGGTEVYKKEGIPYWYCKIKNGRDEFMHIYMDDLSERDLLYDLNTGKPRNFITTREKAFKENVLEALARKPKEGYRWLPVFEPSYDGKDSIQFVKDKEPLVGFNCYKWECLMENYSPENESGKSSKAIYFLLLLRWLKDGIATLEQIADDSTEIGNFVNAKDSKHGLELTGCREFGGLYGFVGNTSKIVVDSDIESD